MRTVRRMLRLNSESGYPFSEVYMKHFLSENGKLYRLLELIMELGAMNVLFLLCSIPLFTIGPAYVALVACADAFWKEEGRPTFSYFFKKFRAAFLPSVLVGCVASLVFILLAYNMLFTLVAFAGAVRIVLLGVYFLLVIVLLAFVYHLARIIGCFQNFRTKYLKAALLATVAHLPRGLGIAAAMVSPLVLLFFPMGVILALLPVQLFFWFSTASVLCIKLSADYMDEIEEYCKN